MLADYSFFICVILIWIVWLAGYIFNIVMVVECATKEKNEYKSKVTWIVVMILIAPIGGILYYLLRRDDRIKENGR